MEMSGLEQKRIESERKIELLISIYEKNQKGVKKYENEWKEAIIIFKQWEGV